MVGFPVYQLDKFVRKLQNAKYTIVVYKQNDNTADITRSLLGIFSPTGQQVFKSDYVSIL